jgi:hypothetical protein
MEPRKVDRWWMIIVAFIAAAAMVLLVLLTESDQASRAPAAPQHSTSLTRTA